MQKQVIFRDRQELQGADFENLQAYVAQTFGDLIGDGISDGRHYAGFAVSQKSATEVDATAGRLYDAGQVFITEATQTLDLFSRLPVAQKRIVALVAWGAGVDTDVEPRDFLVDLTNGTTEPQAVAMTRLQQATLDLVSGAESADPQAPDTGDNVAIAYITLGTTGVESIEQLTGNRLPQARDIDQRLGNGRREKSGSLDQEIAQSQKAL